MWGHHSLNVTEETVRSVAVFGAAVIINQSAARFLFISPDSEMKYKSMTKQYLQFFMRKLFCLFQNNSTDCTCNFQKTLTEVKHFVFFPFTLPLQAHEPDLFNCPSFKFYHFLFDVRNIQGEHKVFMLTLQNLTCCNADCQCAEFSLAGPECPYVLKLRLVDLNECTSFTGFKSALN